MILHGPCYFSFCNACRIPPFPCSFTIAYHQDNESCSNRLTPTKRIIMGHLTQSGKSAYP
ncbi:hypothetical protein CALCODRAFT_109585 [Calocera cornea HHB12733]|uniref:Uncharacterized protein n=1 Tax=Calocera cornea HHB12733 TaxID=1353952 RepID=A0A165D328_9BASI|nr:hypothetical protein CALCODRAFT_109585 [Calocera cornea HHB12733]